MQLKLIWKQSLIEGRSALDKQAIVLQTKQNNLDNKEKLLTNTVARFPQLIQRTGQKLTDVKPKLESIYNT